MLLQIGRCRRFWLASLSQSRQWNRLLKWRWRSWPCAKCARGRIDLSFLYSLLKGCTTCLIHDWITFNFFSQVYPQIRAIYSRIDLPESWKIVNFDLWICKIANQEFHVWSSEKNLLEVWFHRSISNWRFKLKWPLSLIIHVQTLLLGKSSSV